MNKTEFCDGSFLRHTKMDFELVECTNTDKCKKYKPDANKLFNPVFFEKEECDYYELY